MFLFLDTLVCGKERDQIQVFVANWKNFRDIFYVKFSIDDSIYNTKKSVWVSQKSKIIMNVCWVRYDFCTTVEAVYEMMIEILYYDCVQVEVQVVAFELVIFLMQNYATYEQIVANLGHVVVKAKQKLHNMQPMSLIGEIMHFQSSKKNTKTNEHLEQTLQILLAIIMTCVDNSVNEMRVFSCSVKQWKCK